VKGVTEAFHDAPNGLLKRLPHVFPAKRPRRGLKLAIFSRQPVSPQRKRARGAEEAT
jgi:hypothetical protein